MNLAFNPKDANTFLSACLDRTVKMWSLGSSTPNFSMEAHEKGVNYVDFYPGADKPYLVTTGDDKTVKVWDYLSKSCVQTMEGHTNNVSFAVFHPNLPIIISGSEDGTIKIWNSGTYRIENTLSYALERSWCVSLRKDANEVAVGFDEGVVVIKVRSLLQMLFYQLNNLHPARQGRTNIQHGPIRQTHLYPQPRRPLRKPPNHLRPLSIHLIHRWHPSPPHN